MAADPPTLPELPPPTPPEALKALDSVALAGAGAELTAAERTVIIAMAPFDRILKEIRARQAELATEERRRERAERHAARIAVRAGASTGALPTLADALAAGELPLPDDRPLRDVRAYLKTGGEVGFGFGTKPGTMAFTDGRRTVQARTVGEARGLWADGLEPGTPGIPGVRVHLAGTRVERVAPIDGVVVDVGTGTEADS